MAKADRGTKRTCSDCGAKFYDLGQTEIDCPKCGHPHKPTAAVVSKAKVPVPEPAVEVVAEKAPEPAEEAPENKEKVVSLEEADAEVAGASSARVAALDDEVDDDLELGDDVDVVDDDADDAGLLESDDDFEDDVAVIIDPSIEDKV